MRTQRYPWRLVAWFLTASWLLGSHAPTSRADETSPPPRVIDIRAATAPGVPANQEVKIDAITFAPDGKTVACASTTGVDSRLPLWDVASAQLKQTIRPHPFIEALAFSPDGRSVAAGYLPGSVEVWDTTTGRRVQLLKWLVPVVAMRFAANEQHVQAVQQDETMVTWDVVSGRLLRTIKLLQPPSQDDHPTKGSEPERLVMRACFSPDGKWLAAEKSNDIGVRLWDLTANPTASAVRPARSLSEQSIRAMTFASDGVTLGLNDFAGGITIENLYTHDATHTASGLLHSATAIAFTPDCETLAAGTADGSIGLWSVETGKLKRSLQGPRTEIKRCAFSPDGKVLAAGGADGKLELWSIG